MPVHSVLAGMLAEWKMCGWAEMMGRAPTPDDLISPSRTGEMRSRHHSRNKLLDDLARLGLRHRRGHDLRRTFVTLCRVDGARKDILEMVTHSPRGDIVNVHTSMPWASLCEEVAKLKIERRLGKVICMPKAAAGGVGDGGGEDAGDGRVGTRAGTGTRTGSRLTSPLTSVAVPGGQPPADAGEKVVEAPGIERRLLDVGFAGSGTVSLEKSEGCELRKATRTPVSVVGKRSDCSIEVSELQRVLRAIQQGDIPLAKQLIRSLIGRATASMTLAWSLPVPKGPRRRGRIP